MRGAGAALVTLAFALGCDGPAPIVPPVLACEQPAEGVGLREEAASAPDRRLLGLASPYPADAMLRERHGALVLSQRERRAAAWDVVARVVAPVALAEPTPVEGASVPRFRTWYDRDDVRRVFQRAYGELTPEERAARTRIEESALDDTLGWNIRAVDEQDTWPADRWADYVAALEDEAAIAGVGGLRRITMSPDAARHVIASYPDVLRCLAEGAPPAFVDAPAEATQRLAREQLELTRCDARTEGPFFVASGGTLRAVVEGERAGDAELVVSEGATAGAATAQCTAAGSEGCTVSGPGVFFVRVTSGPEGLAGALEVEHSAPDITSPACLDGPFPLASATIAAEWRRVEPGDVLPTFDTSGAALAARLAEGADATWGEGDGEASPGADSIYTMRLPSGASFQLVGLHIRTRELERWMNITLWFSPDPESDFGADRPDSVRALGGPWSSYKMCVAIEHDEHDDDPSGGFGDVAPSLAAALAATHEGRGGPSWCSNPYIDAAPGLVRSNCVGCHQHAMSGVRSAEIATDELRFPESGRLQMRNNLPADGFWGLDAGDDLAAELATVVEWWDSASEAP